MNSSWIKKRSTMRSAVALGFIAWMAALPAFAQGTSGSTCPPNTPSCLQNPLRFGTIETFIQGVLQAIVMIGIPVITVFIVYAGFRFVMARGNASAINEAKKNFVYVILGAALILGAWVLATL